MGMGLWTTEEIKYDPVTGELLSSYEYKPPMATDIPRDLRISLKKDAKNPVGTLGAKGEMVIIFGTADIWFIL